MPATSGRVWVVVIALVAALALGALAFSRGNEGPTPGQIGNCLNSERGEARYLVVRAAYEWGVLGDRAVVVRSADPKVRDLIFDAAGELREWEEMQPVVRHEFLQWATSGDVYARTKDAQVRATAVTTREDCEELLRD